MNPISEHRFDALAGYSRHPSVSLHNDELAWFEYDNERLLGVLVRHIEDGDFAAAVMGRDALNRFRCINLTKYHKTQEEVLQHLQNIFDKEAASPDSNYVQGDEQGKPLDFFSPVITPERFHHNFQGLISENKYSPARDIISNMMHYYEDPDGNFIEQFQSAAFDARLWELYLFAAFTEQHYTFDRSYAAPYFFCAGPLGTFFAEAVTVNPTVINDMNMETGPPEGKAELQAYLDHYIPIKYGSALYSKLKKEYWTLPHIQGRPIVLAIQDFHYPGSMVWSERHLLPYLYGKRHEPEFDGSGKLHIKAHQITEHKWGNKGPIPSGFFNQPNAEHISAVITNSQATLNKFNRIGLKAGFGDSTLTGIRRVSCINPEPNASNAIEFVVNIHDDQYEETWSEGMNVYHNPHALVPLPNHFLPSVVHHRLQGQLISSVGPKYIPLSSTTQYGTTVNDVKRSLSPTTQATFPFADEERSAKTPLLSVVMGIYEQSPSFLNDRGVMLLQENDYQNALIDFTKTISLDPKLDQAYYNRSLLFSRMDNFADAKVDLLKLVELRPDDAIAFSMLGLVCEKLHFFEESLAAFEKSLSIDPNDKETYFRRALLHQSMHNPKLALNDLNKAIGIDKNYFKAYFNRAAVQLNLDNPEEAINDMKTGLYLHPDLPQAYIGLARAYGMLNKFDEGMSAVTKGISLGHEPYEAHSLRGALYASSGQADEAISDFDVAISLNPDRPKPYFLKALLFDEMKGDASQALVTYQQFLSMVANTLSSDPEVLKFIEFANKRLSELNTADT